MRDVAVADAVHRAGELTPDDRGELAQGLLAGGAQRHFGDTVVLRVGLGGDEALFDHPVNDPADRRALGQRRLGDRADAGRLALAQHRHHAVDWLGDAVLVQHDVHVLVIFEVGVRHQVEGRVLQPKIGAAGVVDTAIVHQVLCRSYRVLRCACRHVSLNHFPGSRRCAGPDGLEQTNMPKTRDFTPIIDPPARPASAGAVPNRA